MASLPTSTVPLAAPLPSISDIATILGQLNLNDHRDASQEIVILSIVFICLLILFVGLRLYVRAFLIRKMFVDDILIVFATLFTIAVCVVSIIAAKTTGLGKHIWVIAFSDLNSGLSTIGRCVKSLYVFYIMYACALASTKLSIIVSYLSIFPHKSFRLAMYITAVIVAVLFINTFFGMIFQCTPVESAFNFSTENLSRKKCINFVALIYFSGSVGLFTDLVITILPIPLFWKIKLPRKEKIILTVLFGIGMVACAANLVRIIQLRYIKGYDITFLAVKSIQWSIVECSLGIICVSIPLLRPLVVKLTPDLSKKLSSIETEQYNRSDQNKHSTVRLKLRSFTQEFGETTSQTEIARANEDEFKFQSERIAHDHFGEVNKDPTYREDSRNDSNV